MMIREALLIDEIHQAIKAFKGHVSWKKCSFEGDGKSAEIIFTYADGVDLVLSSEGIDLLGEDDDLEEAECDDCTNTASHFLNDDSKFCDECFKELTAVEPGHECSAEAGFSTPCGTMCPECFPAHMAECEVCRSEDAKFPLN